MSKKHKGIFKNPYGNSSDGKNVYFSTNRTVRRKLKRDLKEEVKEEVAESFFEVALDKAIKFLIDIFD